jgi:transposase
MRVNASKQKRKQRTARSRRPFVAKMPLPVPRELLSAGIELDPEFEQERQLQLESLKADLTRLVAEGKAETAIDQVLSLVVDLGRENDRLSWRLLQAVRYRFGRRTEQLSREDLQQLFLALGGDPETAQTSAEPTVPAEEPPEQGDPGAEATGDDAAASTSNSEPAQTPKEKKKRKRVRSMKVAPEVERNVTPSAVSAEERTCALCGHPKKVIGFVEHQCIRFVPAKIVVDVERREKLACEDCRKDVSVAPRTATPSVVRKVDASLLAKLATEKCSLALPLDRQRRQLARLGLDIPDKTLQSYWSYTADLIEPVALAVLADVFASAIVGADDSHLRTLDKSSRHGSFRGHIWCFVGTDGTVGGPETVAYGYTPSWEAREIVEWFAAIDGFIQVDGYAGYSREVEDDEGQSLVAVPDERRLGCGMHIRGKFQRAFVAKDRRAAIPLKHFVDLYAIEEDCKVRGLDADARGDERRRRSLPLLDAFDGWVDAIHPRLLPKSPLRQATTYAIHQRRFFRRCFEGGRFEIDNGRTERRIRPYAVARRNFLFTGSARGGERLAVVFTLVDGCLILGIDPYLYLLDIIRKLESGWPLRRLSELMPARWAREQAAQQRPQ